MLICSHGLCRFFWYGNMNTLFFYWLGVVKVDPASHCHVCEGGEGGGKMGTKKIRKEKGGRRKEKSG